MLRRIKQTGEDERVAFETIGEKLRQARLNKKISLDELQQITKIQKRYLEAIDNDDLTNCLVNLRAGIYSAIR